MIWRFGGSVSYFRTPPGSSQAKVHMSSCTPAGRGITIVSPSSATIVPCPEFSKPLTCCSSGVSAVSQPAAVVTAPQTATGQQPKVPVHVNSQMTVNQARNAVRTGEFVVDEVDMNHIWCLMLLRVPFFSCVSQSGPTHSSSDPHPVCSYSRLPATLGSVLTDFLQSGTRMHPGGSGNGLRRCLSHPTQCQRCFFGGRRSETCAAPECGLCQQLRVQQHRSDLQSRQGQQGCLTSQTSQTVYYFATCFNLYI